MVQKMTCSPLLWKENRGLMKYFSDLTWIFILPVISQLQIFVGQRQNIQKIG